jgi:hypothetical protein
VVEVRIYLTTVSRFTMSTLLSKVVVLVIDFQFAGICVVLSLYQQMIMMNDFFSLSVSQRHQLKSKLNLKDSSSKNENEKKKEKKHE